LCKTCHLKVHNDEIIINGYKDTSDGLKLDYKFLKNNTNPNCNQNPNTNSLFDETDIEKLRTYILFNKNKVCYFRNTKTSKFNRCEDEKKILKKINNILNVKIDEISEELRTLLIDYKL